MQLEGIYPVVPTPFEENGDVDHESIEKLTAFMIEKGVNGLAVLGALGEGHKLDQNERNQVIRQFKSNLP
jgi:4-hydroxy-tetrahydrodipicolinate synthase